MTDNLKTCVPTEGSVVQIDPEHDERFGACLMVVTEVKPWGYQGYVKVPAQGLAFYRVPKEKAVYVGEATWLHADDS